MTALYVIAAFFVIFFVLFGVYLIGVDDGVKAEQMRRNLYIITLDEEKRHTITHADMVQLEAAKNNEKEKDNEDEE